ncbi:MAG: hypothetical protein AABZ00_16535 [Chloroflexota bacterium]
MKQLEIKEKLLSGELSGEKALEFLAKSGKAWQTKEWKQRRAEKIGHTCEKCGEKGILVIQHVWHPPTIQQIFDEVQQENGHEEWIKKNIKVGHVEEEDVCPKCGSDAIRYKEDKGAYICVSNKLDSTTGKRVFCKNIFDKPAKGISNHLRFVSEFEARKNAHNEFNKLFDIHRKVAIRSIEYHERYISMLDEDIKTLCKKCAFKEDKGLIQWKRT